MGAQTPPKVPTLRLKDDALFLRNVSMRLPFRYGKAVLVAAPLLHLRLVVESPSGDAVTAVAGDMLPPKWFDKDPAKSFHDNINDLLAAVGIAGAVYREFAPEIGNPFEVWSRTLPEIMRRGFVAGLNGLTTQFGASLYERAMLDAFGKASGASFHQLLREDRLGIGPGEFSPDWEPEERACFADSPTPRTVHIRHTVGLGDPLFEADLPEAERRVQGLPVSLEAWIRESGVRWFKIKACGDVDKDAARLEAIHRLLSTCAPADYGATLDGNEQFASLGALNIWWTALRERPALNDFWRHVLFFEQPIERAHALEVSRAEVEDLGPDFPPLLVDESDDSPFTFLHAIDCGYRGVSAKNCKGVFKSVLNAQRAARMNRGNPGRYFLSAEDLCNQPVVPLQQDLCVASALGVTHAERNGHHYAGLLAHLSPADLANALTHQSGLYEALGDSGRLRIRGGAVDVSGLQSPGLGTAEPVDFDSMIPVADWKFASLGIDE